MLWSDGCTCFLLEGDAVHFSDGSEITRRCRIPTVAIMISEERDRERGAKNLLWAFLASILVHALILPVAFWSWTQSVAESQRPSQREWVVSSTAVRIEHRTVPQPRSNPVPPQPQPAPPRPL